jgi:hypothetical protein
MGRIGLITKTATVAAAISIAAVSVALSAFAQTQSDEHSKRLAALAWAKTQQQAAVRLLLPPATGEDVVLPVCRVISIRPSSYSDDWREFHILIKERCDHTITYAAVTTMPTPLIYQMAQMKIEDNSVTVDAAVQRLKFDRVPLPPARAKQILKLLDRARVTFTPLQAFVLDSPGVEVSIVSWGELRVVTYLGDTRPGWKGLNAALREALRLSDINLDRLRFDPSAIEH